jgi:hypothetical protein
LGAIELVNRRHECVHVVVADTQVWRVRWAEEPAGVICDDVAPGVLVQLLQVPTADEIDCLLASLLLGPNLPEDVTPGRHQRNVVVDD